MRYFILLFCLLTVACTTAVEYRPLIMGQDGKTRQFPDGNDYQRIVPVAGLDAAKPAAAAGNTGLIYLATDTNFIYRSTGAAWVLFSMGGLIPQTIGAVPNGQGVTVSSNLITLQPASASFGGVVTTGTQTIAGAKTFTGAQTFTGLQTFSNNLVFSGTRALLNLADNDYVTLCGGSSSSTSSGAVLRSYGTTHASNAGQLILYHGNATGASVDFRDSTGDVLFSAIGVPGTPLITSYKVFKVTDTTDATSLTAAALVCNGGVAVAKKLYVGTGLIVGTDPGGSELLRIGGAAKASGIITGPAATTSTASFNMPSGTAPTSPVEGDLFNESSKGSPVAYTNSMLRYLHGSAYTTLSNGGVGSTTSEVSILPSGNAFGTATLPANFWKLGKQLRLTLYGDLLNNNSTPTFTVRLKIGAVTLATNTLTMPALTSGAGCSITSIIGCTQTGASGILWSNLGYSFAIPGTTTTYSSTSLKTVSPSVDTTASGTIDITGQFSVSNANNKIDTYSFIVEVIN